MPIRAARERGSSLEQALDELLRVEPYLAYTNFPPVARRPGAAIDLHRRRWKAAGDAEGVLVARRSDGRPLAALCLEHRDFESQHFGFSIARIEAPVAVPDENVRHEALGVLYGAAAEALRGARHDHLSAITSTQDRIATWALQELGAFHVGTKISWMAPLEGQGSGHRLQSGLRLETYERERIRDIDPASWRQLHEWTGKAFDRGPFVFDLDVPHERALAIYQVWTQKALSGEWADVLLVVYDGDEIVAFNSMMWLDDLSEAADVGILGRGIGATLPGYKGLFSALQRECAARRPLGAGFLENETQAATVQTINVFGKLGHLCVRSIASFHMPLDGRRRRA